MKFNVYVLKNTLSNLFASGFEVYPNDNYASVVTADILNESKKPLMDYQLFRVGTFDTETGKLTADDVPTLINFDTRHFVSTRMSDVSEDDVLDKMSDIH